MRRWVALLLVVALAGCGDGKSGVNKVRLGDGAQVSLDLPEDQVPDEDDIRGAVSGIVVNDAIYAVGGAHVQVKGWNYSADTLDDGRFSFLSMPPGIYVVEVTKEKHDMGLATINVKSGDVAKAVLMLPRSAYIAPYHRTLEVDEFHSSVDKVVVGSRDHLIALDFIPMTLILESDWDEMPTAVGDQLDYFLRPEGGSPAKNLEGSGPNPLRVVAPSDMFTGGETRVRFDVEPLGYVPPETSGRIFVTAFYVDPAPEGWSYVGGDT